MYRYGNGMEARGIRPTAVHAILLSVGAGLLFLLVVCRAAWGTGTTSLDDKRIKDLPASLERHVRTLSEKFVPRDAEHIPNLERTADYIRGHLAKHGGRMTNQTFEVEDWNQRNQRVKHGPYRNVIASFGPVDGVRIITGNTDIRRSC